MLAFSDKANSLPRGIYRHYKGSDHEVIDVVHHSETLEELVLYKHANEPGLWVRPLNMFFDDVEIDGKKIRRFTFIK